MICYHNLVRYVTHIMLSHFVSNEIYFMLLMIENDMI